MYIETVPNRNSPPCSLLRESYREGGKVQKRTIANLSKWPPELVENFRALLRGGGTVVELLEKSFDVVRSHPYGHVAAVLVPWPELVTTATGRRESFRLSLAFCVTMKGVLLR